MSAELGVKPVISAPAVSVTSAPATVPTITGSPCGLAVPQALRYCSAFAIAVTLWDAPHAAHTFSSNSYIAPHMPQRCVCVGGAGEVGSVALAAAAAAASAAAASAWLASTSGLKPATRESVT